MNNMFAFRDAAFCLLVLACFYGPARAQFADDAEEAGVNVVAYKYTAGVEITAGGGACEGVFGTLPIPGPWPEQEIRLLSEEVSPGVDMQVIDLDPGVRHMQVYAPRVEPGQKVQALLTFEVLVTQEPAPEETSGFVIPKRLPRELRIYLAASPYIEVNHPLVRRSLKEVLTDEVKAADAWTQVQAMYDWTRERVKYVECELKGAVAALKDGTGDCEELTSLFIALCRTHKIPARTVWVPGHCYPEFYLEDSAGNGRWFKCQAAGTRAFGSLMERPVLQKGDRFKLEWKRQPVRYAAEHLKVQKARSKPKVKFVRNLEDPRGTELTQSAAAFENRASAVDEPLENAPEEAVDVVEFE